MNLTSYKLLVHSVELQNSKNVAAYRTDIADFLCLSVWNGKDVIYLFFIIISERCVITVRNNGLLTMFRFLKRRSIFSILQKLKHSTMQTPIPTDLSPYLVDIFTHTKHIAIYDITPERLIAAISSIATWWNRHIELNQPIDRNVTHCMLALINTLFGYTWANGIPPESTFYENAFRLQANMIQYLASQSAQTPN